MRPAFSVILLTTLIGAGQGLFLAVYAADVLVREPTTWMFFTNASLVAAAFAILGLAASFFHLGRPMRAWRSAAKWRTSWLSREVIVLPLFIAGAIVYAGAHHHGWRFLPYVGACTLVACVALFVCTGMIYACLKFLQEWASPLTLVNFALLGCASGATLASALAAWWAPMLATDYAIAAIVLTLLGCATRAAALVRNARLRPKSTPQSAIGIKHPRIVQKAQGFMGGSFNTREFFHGARPAKMRAIRSSFLLLAFAVPVIMLLAGIATGSGAWLALAFVAQYAGLLTERWYFFAQANHPQNIYYQAIS